MYLLSLAHDVPDVFFTQQECWHFLQQHRENISVTDRSFSLLEKVLTGDSGIAKRHFAISDLPWLFSAKAEALNNEFERNAPALAKGSLLKALSKANLKASDLDVLIVCTCTGYLCPGLTSHVSEQLGMRSDAFLQDLVGLGCGAAIPALRAASYITKSNPTAKVAVIAVEVCSAAFYLDNDPGVLISACLFGDGASASIWQGIKPMGKTVEVTSFDTVHLPQQRELIRFVNSNGYLKNKLHKTVPQEAANAVTSLFRKYTADHARPDTIISHTGGRDVLLALGEALPEYDFAESHGVLNDFGNMSSPSVLFALERRLLQERAASENLWLTSFGAGFAAHSCSIKTMYD